MTQDQIIQWAREAGFPCINNEPIIACGRDKLTRFAALVRSAALDEAAAVCDAATPKDPNCVWEAAYKAVGEDHAAAIRALKAPA